MYQCQFKDIQIVEWLISRRYVITLSLLYHYTILDFLLFWYFEAVNVVRI